MRGGVRVGIQNCAGRLRRGVGGTAKEGRGSVAVWWCEVTLDTHGQVVSTVVTPFLSSSCEARGRVGWSDRVAKCSTGWLGEGVVLEGGMPASERVEGMVEEGRGRQGSRMGEEERARERGEEGREGQGGQRG